MSSIVLGIFSAITDWIGSWFQGILDWFVHIFEDIFNFIPKIIYLLNTAMLSIMDVLQMLFRKLAGLDVYYANGVAMKGDLLTNFISGILGIKIPDAANDPTQYSLLSTIFWSFVIFGLILLVATTIIAIVKSHYALDGRDVGNPKPILISAGKALLNMIVVPFVVVLGLFLSQAVLQALDSITMTNESTIEQKFGSQVSLLYSAQTENGRKTYTFYDIFGYGGGGLRLSSLFQDKVMADTAAASQPFSGSMFKVAAYNANRVRSGYYGTDTAFTGNGGGGLSLFSGAGNDSEIMADLIDTAFANFLHLKTGYDVIYKDANKWLRGEMILTTFKLDQLHSFSRYDVGAVWYYYNLWNYNFIVGFGAVIIFLTIFFNITFAMMKRFFMCLVLILIMPAIVGVSPLDGGNGFKNWVKNFVSNAIMAYGAVVGMNLVLVILPFINNIAFFDIPIADLLCQTLFMIVGMLVIKDVIAMISSLIGGADAYKQGDDISKDVKKTAGKIASTAMKFAVPAARLGTGAVKFAAKGAVKGAKFIGTKAGQGLEFLGGKAAQGFKFLGREAAGLIGGGHDDVTNAARNKKENAKEALKGAKEAREKDLKALKQAAKDGKIDPTQLSNLTAGASGLFNGDGSFAEGIDSKNLLKKYKEMTSEGIDDLKTQSKIAKKDYHDIKIANGQRRISNAGHKIHDAASNFAQGFNSKIIDPAVAGVKFLADKVNNTKVVKGIKKGASVVGKGIGSAAKAVGKGIGSAAKAVGRGIKSFGTQVTKILNSPEFVDFFNKFKGSVKEMTAGMINTFRNEDIEKGYKSSGGPDLSDLLKQKGNKETDNQGDKK